MLVYLDIIIKASLVVNDTIPDIAGSLSLFSTLPYTTFNTKTKTLRYLAYSVDKGERCAVPTNRISSSVGENTGDRHESIKTRDA